MASKLLHTLLRAPEFSDTWIRARHLHQLSYHRYQTHEHRAHLFPATFAWRVHQCLSLILISMKGLDEMLVFESHLPHLPSEGHGLSPLAPQSSLHLPPSHSRPLSHLLPAQQTSSALPQSGLHLPPEHSKPFAHLLPAQQTSPALPQSGLHLPPSHSSPLPHLWPAQQTSPFSPQSGLHTPSSTTRPSSQMASPACQH